MLHTAYVRRPVLVVLLLLATGCGSGGLGSGGRPAENPRTVLQLRDAQDGEVIWEVERPREEGTTEPLVTGNRVLMAEPAGDLTAYDVRDGMVRWKTKGTQLPEAVVDGMAVFDLADRVEARRLADGAVVWTVKTAGDVVRSREGNGIVLVDDGRSSPDPSCGSSDSPCLVRVPGVTAPGLGESKVSLLDPGTGGATWTVTSTQRASSFNGGVSESVALIGVADAESFGGEGSIRALSLTDGRTLWELPANSVSHVATSGELLGVVVDLERPEGRVLDPATGRVLWKTSVELSPVPGQPFLDGRPGGVGFRRDPRTGNRLPGTVPIGLGLGAFGDVLVGAKDTTMKAVKGADVLWTVDLPSGVRPNTLVDLDARWVASITAVGQAEQGD